MDAVTAVQALGVPLTVTSCLSSGRSNPVGDFCPKRFCLFARRQCWKRASRRKGQNPFLSWRFKLNFSQMAADSASFAPNLPRCSRYLASEAELELVQSNSNNATQARSDCLRNVQSAAAAEEISLLECRAYFNVALKLPDYDSAKRFLDRWEKAAPDDTGVLQKGLSCKSQWATFQARFSGQTIYWPAFRAILRRNNKGAAPSRNSRLSRFLGPQKGNPNGATVP